MVQFLLVRRDDLVHIGLQFSQFLVEQLTVTGGSRPRFVAMDQALITVTFPPQAMSENDFIWFNLVRRTFSICSGPSRVAFSVPAGTELELTAKGVLTALQSPNVVVVPSEFGARNQPTVLEIPWKLLVTPVPRDTGAPGASVVPILSNHPIQPVTSPAAVTGLWRARLQAPDGDATDAGIALMPLANVSGDMPRPGHLTENMRGRIVDQMKLGLRRPIARRFELTTIGGSLQVAGNWGDLEWSQDIILGRDHKIRTLVGGVLYPFGHRALLTIVTEREFAVPGASSAAPHRHVGTRTPAAPQPLHHGNGNGNGNGHGHDHPPPGPFPKAGVAGLVSSSTLSIVEPVRTFAHDLPHGRQFPFHEVEILGRAFIDMATSFDPIFIIRDAAGAEHQFAVRCAGANANVSLSLPLLFVEDNHTGDAGTLQDIWNSAAQRRARGRAGSPVQGIAVELPGVPINMFPGAARQNDPRDLYELHEVVVDGVQEGDFFHPVLSQFTAELPTLRALQQQPSVSVPLTYAQDFLTQGDQVDVALAMAGQVGIDFTAHPERSGGLMAPSYKVDAISHKLGPIPNTGPLAQAFQATTLLGLPLLDIVDAGSLVAPTIVPLPGDPPGASMTWALTLKQSGPFVPNSMSTAKLTVNTTDPPHGAAATDGLPQRGTTCEVDNFKFVLPPADVGQPLVTLTFGAVIFTEKPGNHPDLQIKGLELAFFGPLKLINDLITQVQDHIDHSGATLQALPSGIRAGYTVGIPSIQTGDFLLQNVVANVAVDVPFGAGAVTVSLGFASRDNPFNLSVLALGGGGYIALELGKNGTEVSRFEAAMEFGAAVSINFLVASAEVHALGGVRFLAPSLEIDAFIRIGGSVDVLGLVSVSIDLVVLLGYQSSVNKLIGHATLVIEVDLTLFSKSVTLDSGDWVVSGSPAPHIALAAPAADGSLDGLLQYFKAFGP